ncbi:Cys-tRNA(Pro) deacylase [Acidipropionibacterium virtanenii]|uniref:Cys-tRNA(Pro)/Cys-tRNA(Cys) deacylase n=1 Tax=Acidipropionibacterium virtanenii TaxID=2057246 RepID=A0A344UQ82_9ACTN|nr:Cys-tRNA(Pro) deacylase [Acidipropionibacterium virtanenii]AXE37430.1 Cys-tRNA(Pro)/Cys-tRNA(Cys) deacylase YbaK [Acidipropionibacterium virtanenii]
MPHSDAASPATRALARAKVEHTLHAYEHDPTNHHYGEEGAARLGLPPEVMFKTLVVRLEGSGVPTPLAVGVVPVSGMLDLKAFAAAMGAKRATMADPADAQRATGYIVGGISPLGTRKRLPTCIDSSALDHDTMLVSGGRRGLSVELAPADLIRVIGASTAPIAG